MEDQLSVLGMYMEDNFDIDGLIDLGFLNTKDPNGPNYVSHRKDYQPMANRIKVFFGLKRISDYSKLPPFGPGLKTEGEKQVTEIVSPKDWLLDGSRLVNLIENN